MSKRIFFLPLFFIFLSAHVVAGDDHPEYAVKYIPADLRENAVAVIRDHSTVVDILKPGKATSSETMVITILKNEGNFLRNFVDGYDKFSKISYMEGYLYDAYGNFIRKIKNSEVIDQSYSGENEFASDVRIKVIEFNAVPVPCTVEFREEKNLRGYISLPVWHPVDEYNVSLEKSHYTLKHPADLPVKYLAQHIPVLIPDKKITKDGEELTWSVDHLLTMQDEPFAPSKESMLPGVMATSMNFSLDDFNGSLESWSTFGKFIYDLNKGKDQFKKEAKFSSDASIVNTSDKKAVAAKLYQYLQNNTRYVSVQFGIGGFQSSESYDVDKYKIGDCKALTTYMKAMLKRAGINSFLVLVHAGPSGVPIPEDFAYNFFNHVILAVPFQHDTCWLECTSQNNSFGYLGSFTEGHIGLLLSESGSRLVRIPASLPEENLIYIRADVKLNNDLSANATVNIEGHHFMQDELRHFIRKGNTDELKDWIVKLIGKDIKKINSIHAGEISNDHPDAEVSCELEFSHLMSKAGMDYVLELNNFTGTERIPESILDRKFPVCNERPFVVKDFTTYHLSEGMEMPAVTDDSASIDSDFGSFKSVIHYSIANRSIQYTREFKMNKFLLPALKYNDLRKFLSKVYQADKQSTVIKVR